MGLDAGKIAPNATGGSPSYGKTVDRGICVSSGPNFDELDQYVGLKALRNLASVSR